MNKKGVPMSHNKYQYVWYKRKLHRIWHIFLRIKPQIIDCRYVITHDNVFIFIIFHHYLINLLCEYKFCLINDLLSLWFSSHFPEPAPHYIKYNYLCTLVDVITWGCISIWLFAFYHNLCSFIINIVYQINEESITK